VESRRIYVICPGESEIFLTRHRRIGVVICQNGCAAVGRGRARGRRGRARLSFIKRAELLLLLLHIYEGSRPASGARFDAFASHFHAF